MSSMKPITTFWFVGVSLLLSGVFIASCSSTKEKELHPHALSLRQVQELRVGVEFESIKKLLLAMISDFPVVYWCSAKEGGAYLFYFFPTKETGWLGTPPQRMVLFAVTKVGDTNVPPAISFSNEYYVLPKKLFGKPCTGLATPNEFGSPK